MKRKDAAIAAALTLTLTLAACGGGDSGLSKEELIAKGDQICRTANQQIQAKATEMFKETPSTPELIKFAKDELVPTFEDQVDQLKALEPGDDARDSWNAIVTKLETGVEDFSKDPAATVTGKGSPFDEAAVAAQEFGMKECGSQD